MLDPLTGIHTTADGREIHLSEMTAGHLRNTIAMVDRWAIDGKKIECGGGGGGPDTMYYGYYVLEGDALLEHFCRASYEEELARRQKERAQG